MGLILFIPGTSLIDERTGLELWLCKPDDPGWLETNGDINAGAIIAGATIAGATIAGAAIAGGNMGALT